jgi:hypothetical protein
VGGRYAECVSLLGLDDDSGPYASVDVEIRVDGQTRWSRKGVLPGTLHGPVRVDLRGAKELELSVGFGANGDIQDRFNWVEAALVR